MPAIHLTLISSLKHPWACQVLLPGAPCLASTVCQCQGPALTLTGTAGQQPFGVFFWPGPPLGAPWPS